MGRLERFNKIIKDPIHFKCPERGNVIEIRACPETEEILWMVEFDDEQFNNFNFTFSQALIIRLDSEYIPFKTVALYSLISKDEKQKTDYYVYFSGA